MTTVAIKQLPGHVRIAPSQRHHSALGEHRIECWDYSVCEGLQNGCSRITFAGLLQQASVDLGEHLSMHPALRASHMQVGMFWFLLE